MPHDYFRFKQFTVHQDRCAMKVTMDACIFGAWVPVPEGVRRVLDVGTGTGLLSLMLAQRFPEIEIDAVEVDEDSAAQAAENVAASPFADRIRVIRADARKLPLHRKYDAIVSNPPFFSQSLQGGDSKRMNALHDNTLGMNDLLRLCAGALHQNGRLAVLWPVLENRKWRELAATKAFYRRHELCIHPNSAAPRTRTASTYSRGTRTSARGSGEVLYIAASDGSYTLRYASLLRPFYLNL